MKVKLRNDFFAGDKGRFRRHPDGDAIEMPDHLAGILPQSATLVEGSNEVKAVFAASRTDAAKKLAVDAPTNKSATPAPARGNANEPVNKLKA